MIRKLLFLGLLAVILNFAIADKFTWDFYRQFASTRGNKNFVISPASLALVLGLAKEGATGETKGQMDAGLGGIKFDQLSQRLNTESSLKSGNKIYIKQGYSLKQNYKQKALSVFKSTPESLDFSKSRDAAAEINRWIEQTTEGVLKNVVSPSSLTPDMTMLLINTIFFKGSWVHGFKLNKLERYKRTFYLTRENSFKMDSMETDEKKFKYAESDELKLQAVELPYEGTNLKMVILLPNFDKSLSEIERNLNDDSLKQLFRNFELRDATVTMPKIKIDSDFSCVDELKAMGMTKMFNDNAEFGEFVEQKAGMKVSDVHQRAFIDINEHGTIAAVSTQIKFVLLCSGCGPVDFAVNRPFLFLIKDDDFIYFMGRVVDPRI